MRRNAVDVILVPATCFLWAVLLSLLAFCSSIGCSSFQSHAISPLDHRVCAVQIVYCSDQLEQDTCDALQEAIGYFNREVNGTVLHYGGRGLGMSPTLVAVDSQIVVVGSKPPGGIMPEPLRGRNLGAYTAMLASHNTLCLRAAYIVLLIDSRSSSPEGMQNVLRHELAHILGLLDSGDQSAVSYKDADMFAHDVNTLTEAERNALKVLYKGSW